jgi:hypothetical protein
MTSDAQTAAPSFTAAQSAAGYYYQARLALFEGLRFAYSESEVEVAIERFDDVSFEDRGTPLELLQTKHHVTKKGDLTDASADIWKTLRVWSEAVKKDPSLPARTRLVLITTAKIPPGSAASYLRPQSQGQRDPVKAEALLSAAGQQSQNKDLTRAIEAFNLLAPEMRKLLVSAIEIMDDAPILDDLEKSIEERLRLIAPRGKAAVAREQLEGWWWPRICKSLVDGKGTISILELEAKLDDIREMMKRDALPVDMEDAQPGTDELSKLNEMIFVRQLNAVGLGSARIEYAKRDYYRAFTQRSQWARQNLLFDGEVSKFEQMLVEEWEPRFQAMCEELNTTADEAAVRAAGRNLYGWVETDARFPFRTMTKRFLNVGSYHMLAESSRLGWHRNYDTVLTASREKEDA